MIVSCHTYPAHCKITPILNLLLSFAYAMTTSAYFNDWVTPITHELNCAYI